MIVRFAGIDRTRLIDRRISPSCLYLRKPQSGLRMIGAVARNTLLVIAVLTAACGSRVARAPVGSAPPSDTTAAIRPSADARVAINISPSAASYRIESRSAVFALSDTLTPVDSVALNATATLRARRSPEGGIIVSGVVEQLSVTSGMNAAQSTQNLVAPFSLEWRLTGDSLIPPGRPAGDNCDQLEETARDVLVSLLPPLPESVAADQNWRYGQKLESCRSGLLLLLTSTSAVQVAAIADESSAGDVVLRSTGEITVSGRGTQGLTSVILNGTGSTRVTHRFNSSSGAIQSSRGESRLQLEFDLGYRTDRFVQYTIRTATRVQ